MRSVVWVAIIVAVGGNLSKSKEYARHRHERHFKRTVPSGLLKTNN
jgi:hypothetical protein